MNKLPIYFAVMFVALTGSAQAALHSLGEDKGDAALYAKLPAEWARCTASADCQVLAYECGMAIAVRKDHLSEAKQMLYQVVQDPATVNCYSIMAEPHYVAGCVNGKCVATNPTE